MADQEEVQRQIGAAIRVWARVRRVTLKSIAADLEMSEQSFYERLRGKTAMTITELTRIAELLDVGVADIVAPPKAWVAGESNPEPADIGRSSTSIANVKNGQSGTNASRSSAAA